MSNRTCSMPECDKKHRARGLCSTHYNHAYFPDRHPKKLVACAYCGKEILKAASGGRKHGPVCSNECRRALNPGPEKKYSRLPKDHWALWFGKASTWPRFGMYRCEWCGIEGVAKGLGQKYCSSQCMWRNIKGVKFSREQMLNWERSCIRCGESFTHQSIGRTHCSDICRDLGRIDRGITPLTKGWISRIDRLSIYMRDDFKCWLCGEAVDLSDDPKIGNWSPSLDHVVPRSKGGTHEHSNLRTAHRWCNSVRSDSEVNPLQSFAC